MTRQTALYQQHIDNGATMVPFGGWDMPLHYGSQIEEHHAVRNAQGIFDVSHMTVLDMAGEEAKALLQALMANDVAKLSKEGKALYTCMLNEQGGVIDDLIVYWRGGDAYRLVLNAATRDKDLQWIYAHAESYQVCFKERDDLAMLAIQGPGAIEKTQTLIPNELAEALEALKPFNAIENEAFFVARTGYTGEDGVEIMMPTERAESFWQAAVDADIKPCGLGARDTLRLEAGLNLYGSDMTEDTSPLESNLAWTVAWQPEERDFIGREALSAQKSSGLNQKLVGLVLESRGVLRSGQKVLVEGIGEGEVTSGTFSPTLKQGIALARVPAAAEAAAMVEVRGKSLPVTLVKPPFVQKKKR